MPNRETAATIKPHTEAKLQFYTRYLQRYLKILIRASHIKKINIYDMFCGEGIYSDGNTGSAVRAVDAIWETEASNSQNKPINLHLNDLSRKKTDKLKSCLRQRQSDTKQFSISYSNIEAAELLNKLGDCFTQQNRHVRNLVFIDPYGYKAIRKHSLENLIADGKTELILFLPIEQMYRFRNKTIGEHVAKAYQPLKSFIDQFDLGLTTIDSEKAFIKALDAALAFNPQCYATSYSIKNHTGHYYALFFITANLLGLEKIIEVKWQLDDQEGDGFTAQPQQDFILELEKHSQLELQLKKALQSSDQTNTSLYTQVLSWGFLPKHANAIFRRWQGAGRLEVYDNLKEKPARKGTFKLNYNALKQTKAELQFTYTEVCYEQN